MLIRCPECSTSFSIPEKALGSKGRTLKCARCGHTWFQAPLSAARDMGLGLDESSLPPINDPPPRPPAPPSISQSQPLPDLAAPITSDFESALDFALGKAAISEERGEPPLEQVFDMPAIQDKMEIPPLRSTLAFPNHSLLSSDDDDEDRPPVRRPIPKPSARRSGTWGLWLLLVLLLLGGTAGVGYHYQDDVVAVVPEVGEVLTRFGLRHEQPGAGLVFRDAGAPERKVINQTEVLVVYGVIANETSTVRSIPPLQLVLLGGNGETLQSKIDPPPKTELEPGGTTTFRLVMEKPDPAAVTMNVLFVDPSLLPTAATTTPEATPAMNATGTPSAASPGSELAPTPVPPPMAAPVTPPAPKSAKDRKKTGETRNDPSQPR